MWPGGFWSWTGEKVFRLKETIHPGWSRKRNGWNRKKKRNRSDRKHCNRNWIGFVKILRDAARRVKRGLIHTKSCFLKSIRNAGKIWRSIFRPAPDWVTKLSLQNMFLRDLMIGC